eukprot:CAMPEP_0197433022 /NCGR_PEP_ID=MMETSP1175-20131217/973_1 /TAXON_ID=1003142 /ORGANISM="Triceratium dubium, Strain CCMP147" /LENGTH=250 /DNA_ID=CAMNT_0042961265 /DNA_START=805 /DNA_END=1553 /DNA_ORIENTATION=-
MSKCYCKYYPQTVFGNDTIETGTRSATLLEALIRNEPDEVVLDVLDADTDGMAQMGSVCVQYAYYAKVKQHNVCKEKSFQQCEKNGWQPSDGYDGVDCLTTSSWSTYPLQFALIKKRSFAVINAMLSKHKQAAYREQKNNILVPAVSKWGTGYRCGEQKFRTESMDGAQTYWTYWLPLHYAACQGDSPEITELLIRAYPQALDVEDLQYRRGRTPREIARRAGDALDSESLDLLMKPTSYWTESEGNNIP